MASADRASVSDGVGPGAVPAVSHAKARLVIERLGIVRLIGLVLDRAELAEFRRRRQQHFLVFQRQEALARALAREEVRRPGQQAEAAAVGEQQRGVGRAGKVVLGLAARLQVDQ
mgnify:CR=1 FL=1